MMWFPCFTIKKELTCLHIPRNNLLGLELLNYWQKYEKYEQQSEMEQYKVTFISGSGVEFH
jgi:hypothetical protein